MALNKFGPAVDSRFSPEIGQYFYMVDSNYRTAAQGWSKADGTGPLDLWNARQVGNDTRVFYTPETGIQGTTYASQAAAVQAAIDAMTDFRGDTLFWTPGNYSVATALAINVPDARWLGPVCGSPQAARATLTAAVAAAFAITGAADRMEVGFLRFVPLTAATQFTVATGAEYLHFHDFAWDTRGIAASTSTIFLDNAGTMNGSLFEKFSFYTDDSQGAMFTITGDVVGLTIQDFYHLHAGTNALAISLADDNAAGASGILVSRGRGITGGAGAVTTLYDLVNKTLAETNVTIDRFYGSVGYATTTTIVTSAGAVNDIDIVDSWIATVEGGAGRGAYVGAA